MKENRLTFFVEIVVLPAFWLCWVVETDLARMDTPLSLLLLLGLVGLAFRLPMWAILFWAVVSFILLILVLGPARDHFFPVFALVSGGIIGALLAIQRADLKKCYNARHEVVSKLPLPLVVSDVSGTIQVLNKEAAKILALETNHLAGLSYFSTFADPVDQGQFIGHYVRLFGSSHSGVTKLVLHLRGNEKVSLQAAISIVEIDRQLYAVTVIESVAPFSMKD